MKESRINQIEDLVRKNKSVSIDDICNWFNISTSTARRDFDILEKRGIVEKVYGGLRLKSPEKNNLSAPFHTQILLSPYQERSSKNSEEKEKIGKLASGLVNENDVIFIDSGSTCYQLASNLADTPCTVITNSYLVLEALMPYANIQLITLPGTLNRKTLSFTGSEVIQGISSMNITKAFMASTGISVDGGVTNAESSEYHIKRRVCEKSREIYLLADHTKFNRSSLYTYCSLNQIYCLVTDSKPDEKTEAFLSSHGIRVLY